MKKIVKLPLLLLSLVCILAALQCKKNKNPNSDNGLPPATQDGGWLFACKINGQPFISKILTGVPGAYYKKDTLRVLSGFPKNNNDFSWASFLIKLEGAPIQQDVKYRLNDITKKNRRMPYF